MKLLKIIKTTLLTALFFVIAPMAEASSFYQGYVEGDYLWIGLASGGVVKEVDVQRGDTVMVGQRLFSLDTAREEAALRGAQSQLNRASAQLSDLEKGLRDSEITALLARLEQAKSARSLAKLTLDRQLDLEKKGVSAEQNLDSARANYDHTKAQVAELEANLITARLGARSDVLLSQLAEVERLTSQLDEAQWALDQRTATAPKDGFVEDVFYRAGEFLPQGKAGVSLLPPENLKIRFFVPEQEFAAIKLGQSVILNCDGCGTGLQGKVSYISSKAEFTPPVIYSEAVRDKLVFMVEARFSGVALKPGQPVDVTLAGKK